MNIGADEEKILAVVNVALEECGLAYADIHKDPSGLRFYTSREQDGYHVNVDAYFRFKFNTRRMTTPETMAEEYDRAFGLLHQSILRSPKVQKMHTELEALRVEVQRLKPFETYYDLQYQLLQGKQMP